MFIKNLLTLFQALQRSQNALNEPSSGTGDRKRIFVILFQAVCTTSILLVYTAQPEQASKQTNKQTFHSMGPNNSARHVRHSTHSGILQLSTKQNILGEDSGTRHVARTGEEMKVRDPLGDEMR
jgi:hypothetical protein